MSSSPIRTSPKAEDWILLAILGLIWGGSFMGVEISLLGFGPITIAAARVSIAATILLLYVLILGDGVPTITNKRNKRIWIHCLGMAIFTNALPFSLLSWGQQTVSSGFAGISMAVVPLFVLPLSHFLVPNERLSHLKIIGFLLGFLGVILLVGGNQIFVDQPQTTKMFFAQLACVSASCCYAIGTIITRLCPPVSATSYAACGLSLASLILVPAALSIEGIPNASSVLAIVGVGYLAIFPTAIATILLTILVRRAGPPFLSLVNYQVPIWALIIGATILDEALPSHFLMALTVILLGLFISQAHNNRRPK